MRLRRLAAVIAVTLIASALLPAPAVVADQPKFVVIRTGKEVRILTLEDGSGARGRAVTDTVLRISRFSHGFPLFLGPGIVEITKKSSIEVPDGSPRVKKATFTFDHNRDGKTLTSTEVLVKFKKNGKAKGGKADLPAILFLEGDVLEVSVDSQKELVEGTRLDVVLQFVLDGAARAGAREAGR